MYADGVVSVATAQVLLFTACVYIEIVVKFVSEVMDFFQSEKGGRKLVRDGYIYHKNTTQGNGSTYWECYMYHKNTTQGNGSTYWECYMYHKNTTQGNGSTYWECCERRSGNGCKAKITLDPNDIFVGQSAPHSHPPNPEKVELKKVVRG